MIETMARRLLILLLFAERCLTQPFDHKASVTDTNRSRLFSPRMDYDEWTPLGRGDPLKNDPTFDYVPPVLDRVQYWLDTQSSTEASSKRDILILGVTAKKTSPKIPENFLKFVDGPKFTRNDDYRKDFIGSTGAEPPKIIRATKFRTASGGGGGGSNTMDRNINRIQSIPASYYPSPYYNEKKPYTVMMPPPIQHQELHQQFGPQTEESSMISLQSSPPRPVEHTTNTVTFDKSNLVYQSSQTYDPWSAAGQLNPSINWTDDHYDEDHSASASGNHEVIVNQNANIIVQEDSEENEQVVVGKKENYTTIANDDGVKMHIVMANTTQDSTKHVTVAVVMPTNYNDVNNSKNADIHRIIATTTPVPFSSSTRGTLWRHHQPRLPTTPTRVFPPRRPMVPMNMRPIAKNPTMMNVLTGSSARHPNYELRPTTASHGFVRGAESPLAVVLRPEEVIRTTTHNPMMIMMMMQSTTERSSSSSSSTTRATTTTEASLITSASGFTTDPIFAHYKQPSMPIHGPMYLIIQGHSKVKTYKPTINKHGIPVVEMNSIGDITTTMTTTTSRPISKFEQFVNDNTRVTTTTRRSVVENNHEVKAKEKRVGHQEDSLLSLVESGFSAFTAPPLSQSSSSSSSSSAAAVDSTSAGLFDRSDDDFYDDLFMDNN